MISAPGEPPGSRVSTTPMPMPDRLLFRSAACVDLPAPSPPSNVMNFPAISSKFRGVCCGVVVRVERQRNPGPRCRIESAVPDFAALNPGYALQARYLLWHSRPKQADHQLGGCIKGAPRKISALDVLGGEQRNFCHRPVAPIDIEVADLLPLLHRRGHPARLHNLLPNPLPPLF